MKHEHTVDQLEVRTLEIFTNARTVLMNGRKVALASAQEMFGAPKTTAKEELDKAIYPLQPGCQWFGI